MKDIYCSVQFSEHILFREALITRRLTTTCKYLIKLQNRFKVSLQLTRTYKEEKRKWVVEQTSVDWWNKNQPFIKMMERGSHIGCLSMIPRWRKQQDERIDVYESVLSAHAQTNTSTSHSPSSRTTTINTRRLFGVKRWNILDWPSQSPDLGPAELLKTRLKAERVHNNELKVSTGGASAGKIRSICWCL